MAAANESSSSCKQGSKPMSFRLLVGAHPHIFSSLIIIIIISQEILL
jgi:hypothetical protein